MTDDLDDLRRRNARKLAQRLSDEGTLRYDPECGCLLCDSGPEKFLDRVARLAESPIAETPRRCAADFWNG